MRISDWSSDVCSSDLYQEIIEQSPAVDWFEIVSENYLVQGGKALYYLDAIAARYPLVMHGVSLSIRSEERRVGKSVSVRVDLGGLRIIKKKKFILHRFIMIHPYY